MIINNNYNSLNCCQPIQNNTTSFKHDIHQLRKLLPEVPENQLKSIKSALDGNPMYVQLINKEVHMGWIKLSQNLVKIYREAAEKTQIPLYKQWFNEAADVAEQKLHS